MQGYTLFENNTIGDDSTYIIGGTVKVAQVFTPGTAHKLWTFAIKAANSPTNVKVEIFLADTNGKPAGSALATMNIPNTFTITDPDWVYKELTESLKVDNSKLVAVISAIGYGFELRYQSVGTYTAGQAWYSINSGTDWNGMTGSSFLFEDWGQQLSHAGTYRVPLYPTGVGTYNQLFNPNPATKPNYSCINDPIDAVDDSLFDSVGYSLTAMGSLGTKTDDDAFLSGLADGAAGRLTGTTVLWKSGVAGIWGDGTDFLSELDVDYILRSPTKNEWYTGTALRLSKILSIQSGAAATFANMAGPYPGDYTKSWFYYPHNTATKDIWAKDGYQVLGVPYPGNLPVKYMSGIWTFTTEDDEVTATGGNALSKYPDPDFVFNIITTGRLAGGNWYPCQHIDGDNQVTLWDKFELGLGLPGIHRVGLDGKTGYGYFGFQDDLSSDVTATQFCKPTKLDSYAIKTTLNSNDIYAMYVRYRVYLIFNQVITDYYPAYVTTSINKLETYLDKDSTYLVVWKYFISAELTSLKAYLASLAISYPTMSTVIATAKTCCDNTKTVILAFTSASDKATFVTSLNIMFSALSAAMQKYLVVSGTVPNATAKPFLYMNGLFSYGTEQTITTTQIATDDTQITVFQFEELISRPGGGVFTRDDFTDLEVGIELGNLNDITSRYGIFCSQLIPIAEISSNVPVTATVGLDDVGFIAFADGWDEFNQYVGEDGVNTMGWKVHYTSFSDRWIARPLKLLRKTGIRFVRPISRVLTLRRR